MEDGEDGIERLFSESGDRENLLSGAKEKLVDMFDFRFRQALHNVDREVQFTDGVIESREVRMLLAEGCASPGIEDPLFRKASSDTGPNLRERNLRLFELRALGRAGGGFGDGHGKESECQAPLFVKVFPDGYVMGHAP